MSGLFEDDGLPTAEFSPCRSWRYVLRRRWSAGPTVGFILLNPSTADETKDDPTIRRCIGFAKSLGAGALVLGNLFALRSTDPSALRSHHDPIGPGNDEALHALVREIGIPRTVICGWGTHGQFMGRGQQVSNLLKGEWGAEALALSMTNSGEPGHPLYLRADLLPFEL